MTDPFETPRQRRQRYLLAAENAQKLADTAKHEETRERYRQLAESWRTLADEIWGLHERDRY